MPNTNKTRAKRNYENTIIYRVIDTRDKDTIYFNHTCNLKEKIKHLGRGKNELDNFVNKNGGRKFFKLVFVSECPCKDKSQADAVIHNLYESGELVEIEYLPRLKSWYK